MILYEAEMLMGLRFDTVVWGVEERIPSWLRVVPPFVPP